MKVYKVIDLQRMDFMRDTHENPLTLNELRSRFWNLDEARTSTYKDFTSSYIADVWGVSFEEVINEN